MKKLLCIFLALFFVTGMATYSQTLSIGDIEANIGEEVLVPMQVQNLPGMVGAISIYIHYNNEVLTFDTVVLATPDLNGMLIGLFPPENPETVSLQWFSLTGGVSLENGKILDLKFIFNGGYSDLTIDPGSQIADPFAIPYDNITFVDGSVFGQGGPPSSVWNGNGNWIEEQYWSDGIPGSETDAVIQSGEVTIASGANCENLTINSGTILNISPNHFLIIINDLLVEGELNVLSDETGTGSLISKGNITNNGSINIDRYLNGARNYFVSSPLSDATSDVYNSIEVNTYDEVTQQWIMLNAGEPLDVGHGYEVVTNNNDTFRYTGNPNNTDIIIEDLSYTTDGNTYPAGMNLIGNPYPAAIKWNQGDWQREAVNGAIYTWNGSHYVSWNGSIGAMTDGIIPAMQGFIVFAGSANATITIPTNARLQSEQPFYKEESIEDNKSSTITLLLEGAGYEDVIFLTFNGDATYSFDSEYDAYKLFGLEAAPQFYSMSSDGISLSISEFPTIPANSDTAINLGIKVGTGGELNIVLTEYSIYRPITIRDMETNDIQDLRKDSIFTVSLQAGTYEDRFVLQLDTLTGISENKANIGAVYSHGNFIYLDLIELNKKVEIIVYDLQGRKLFYETIKNAHREEIEVGFRRGIYIVMISGDKGYFTKKLYLPN